MDYWEVLINKKILMFHGFVNSIQNSQFAKMVEQKLNNPRKCYMNETIVRRSDGKVE